MLKFGLKLFFNKRLATFTTALESFNIESKNAEWADSNAVVKVANRLLKKV
jgi:hypothetical protein